MADADRAGVPGEHPRPSVPEFTGTVTAQGLIDGPAPREPVVVPAHPAQPIGVAGVEQQLKRWRFLLVVAGVWIVAAAAGVGLYYWWYQSLDKTMPVFVVLVYLVSCIVGSLLCAMVQSRPVMSATAIALMSAPFASTAAAAVLYGGYVFGWISR